MKNNKAFTVVELLVTFILVMALTIGLFTVVDGYRSRQQKESFRKELVNYRDQILRIVQEDINTKKIDKVERQQSDNCNQEILIKFGDNTNKELCIRDNGIKYGDINYPFPGEVSDNKSFVKVPNDIIYSVGDKITLNNGVESIENKFSSESLTYKKSGSNKYDIYTLKKVIHIISFDLEHEELDQTFSFKAVGISTSIGDKKYSVFYSADDSIIIGGTEGTISDTDYKLMCSIFDASNYSDLTKGDTVSCKQ